MPVSLSSPRLLEVDAGAEHDRVIQVELAWIARAEQELAVEHVADFHVAADLRLGFKFQAAADANVVVIELIFRNELPADRPCAAAILAGRVPPPLRVAD